MLLRAQFIQNASSALSGQYPWSQIKSEAGGHFLEMWHQIYTNHCILPRPIPRKEAKRFRIYHGQETNKHKRGLRGVKESDEKMRRKREVSCWVLSQDKRGSGRRKKQKERVRENPQQIAFAALTAEDHSWVKGQHFKTAVNKHRAGSATSDGIRCVW